jgi:hypothetical protein
MTGELKCIVTFVLVFTLPYFLRMFYRPEISRKRFALIGALSVSIVNFVMAALYVDEHPIVIGAMIFFTTMLGGYPTVYFLYPLLLKRIDFRKKPL